MYPNLSAEISRKRLKNKDVAHGIGISESAFCMRMNGKTKFTVKEALEIKKFLAVDTPIEELFAEE